MSDIPITDDAKTKLVSKPITYTEIAAKLLQDRFLLTALELHTELIESGRELRQLKDFFSNPGNFELQTQELPCRLSRSGSQVTLDSLDLTRFSEDGAGIDERVAVLEFELRKAKETINALRNNLTVATESETSTPDKGILSNINVATIKPHEQRALNFLLNEYLLLHGYKLTSITFADENQNQDFDDWDDVGLNVSRPPELLTLYRDGLKQTGQYYVSNSTQTDITLHDKCEDRIKELEIKLENLKLICVNWERECSDLKNLNLTLQKENDLLSSQLSVNDDTLSLNHKIIQNHKNSLGSDSPERFEIIDKNMSIFKKCDNLNLDDTISNNSFNTSEWTNLTMPNDIIKESESHKEPPNINYDIDFISDEPFQKEVFSLCYVNIPHRVDNDILDNMLSSAMTNETLIHTVSQSLLKIIPNIILNKREEAIPLLISAVCLNPKPAERDKLLQQLFNLKKRPSETERIMILTGLVGIAKCSGKFLVENEILPQCWLQLTHKHVERRLLVAESCIALIPYVSSQIRNSLILSILQQMLEDKEEIVRETVVRAISLLVALCDDSDKYNQCEHLAFTTLNDPSGSVINLNTLILFPVLARWALHQGCLRSSLFRHLLEKFNNYMKDVDLPNKINQSSDKILKVINIFENLLPYLLISVASHDSILAYIEKDMAVELRPEFRKLCTSLTNPYKFYKSDKGVNVGMIIYEFDKYLGEHCNETWSEINWVVDVMLRDLVDNLNHVDISQTVILQTLMALFSHICIVFGKNFTKTKIRPFLQRQIQNLEQVLSSFNQYCPSLNIIPVYLVSVLSYCDDSEELTNILKRFLCVLPLCGVPLDCLEITVKGLCENGFQELVVTSLWDGVVHQRPLIRAASAALFSSIIVMCNQPLICLKVTPALVTLASDNDVLVRTATVPALGSLITDCNIKEIHDKAYMQLQTYLTDANIRDNHALLRQLIVTLGNIVNMSNQVFRDEVILPNLTSLALFMCQMSNQTRKVDMALALIEAFTNVVYSPLNKQSLHSLVLPGLRYLETAVAENQALSSHRETVLSMIRECDNKIDIPAPQSPVSSNKLSQNVNQGVEEMRQRVSKIFNKPVIPKSNTLPQLQGIFKKK